jgi:hypothetical protein
MSLLRPTENEHHLHFDILTLFPEMFAGVFEATIIGRARKSGQVDIVLHTVNITLPMIHPMGAVAG